MLMICGSLCHPQHQNREAPPLQEPTVLQGTSTSGVSHCTVWPGPQTRTQLPSCCLLRSMSKTKPGTEPHGTREAGPVPRPCPRTQISSWLEVGRAWRVAASKI